VVLPVPPLWWVNVMGCYIITELNVVKYSYNKFAFLPDRNLFIHGILSKLSFFPCEKAGDFPADGLPAFGRLVFYGSNPTRDV
jgi:hypothetical protein